MPKKRAATKRIIESSESEDDIPLKKLQSSHDSYLMKKNNADSSSSESDIEDYLHPINKIDLNSSFFKTHKKNEEEFTSIEDKVFAGITRLSDSDSNEKGHLFSFGSQQAPQIELDSKPSTSATKLNFQQLEEFTRQIEEAKKHVENYNAKKNETRKTDENNLDISNLLAVGESKQITLENIKPEDLRSSDFESCDSEREDWEEVKIKDSQESKETPAPKGDIQIIVNMPDTCRKKKGIDLLAAMKRRLNRIRKENQVYVHKVHLLCWIAHGNYVNGVINNTETLGLALSLLPSDKCYPSDRTDLNYLEQIVQWYKKTMTLVEKPLPKKSKLIDSLKIQISKKEAYNKKMLVYIFIAILRALGIQCRLVLSVQVEPLRPPASELHSLAKESSKTEKQTKISKTNIKHNGVKDKSLVIGKSKQSKAKKSNNKKNTSIIETSTLSTDKSKPENQQKKSKESKVATKSLKKPVVDVTANSGTSNEKTGDANISSSELNYIKPKITSERVIATHTKLGKTKNKEQTSKAIIRKANEKHSNCNSDIEKDTKEAKNDKQESKANIKKGNEKQSNSKSVMEKDTKEAKNDKQKLKNKEGTNAKKTKSENKRKELKSDNIKSRESKHSDVTKKLSHPKNKDIDKDSSKKKVIQINLPKIDKVKKIPQLDGLNDSSEEDTVYEFCIPQLDGADDKKEKSKPNLKKLNKQADSCLVKKHPSRLKSFDNDYNSEDDFKPRNPFIKKNTESPKLVQNRKVNLHQLKNNSEPRKNLLSKNQLDVKNDIVNLIKGRIVEQKHIDRNRKVKRKVPPKDSDSDSDFMPEPIKKKHHDSDSDIDYFVPKPKVKQRIRVPGKEKSDRNVLSSDSDYEKVGKKGNNVWAEVFLEAEEKWISVDVVNGEVHCVHQLFTRATHPVSYILAWNNNNNIKDITKRYCTNFNTITRKLRIDTKWWDETLKPFLGTCTVRDKEEDDDLNRQQFDQPLPKTVSEYKNHPLYALRRHLLKFEAIYPPDIQPLGFVRGEEVYPRNSVYVCHSRDIWLKEAKVVKLGEKPYKIVKARPKYDKLSNKVITDQLLEIFGEWQTTDYEPPTAENGIVPRNAFGNVELFKPCMLPKGTVHLKLPGLVKICRRMNIDCADAIVGFDFHGGWSHPVYDGSVVCEEFADSVVVAWELEQDEIEKKENEKIEKRVYGNWKKLIKGLLIRERLKAKYDFGGAGTSEETKEKKSSGPRFCTKKK